MRTWLVLALLAGCTGDATDSSDQTDDTDDLDDCLLVTDSLPGVADGYEVLDGALQLSWGCSEPGVIEDVSVEEFTAEFVVGEPGSTQLTLGGPPVEVPVTFTPSAPGVREETVVVRVSGQPELRHTWQVETRGPELTSRWSEQTLVRTCPATLEVFLDNDGSGRAILRSVATSIGGEDLDNGLAADVGLPSGEDLSFTLAVTPEATSQTLDIAVEEALIGAVDLPIQLDTDLSAERAETFPAWETGRPLDVLITVDRNLPGLDVPTLQEGLGRFLESLASQDADYRVAGLLQDSGCPLGAGPVSADLPLDDAAARLSAQLDLNHDRVGDGAFVDEPFTVVGLALAPANTAKGACNEWIRPEASLLVLHVTHRDDASATSPEAYVDSLSAHVALPDQLQISAIVPPPPDGCEDLPPASRIADAVSRTGGRGVAPCGVDWRGGFAGLAVIPGEENTLKLDDPPYPPSLQVLVAGAPITDFTLDGTLLTLPRSVDRFRDEVAVTYVTARSCP